MRRERLNVRLERAGEPQPVASTFATAGSLGDFRTVVHIPENAPPVPHTVTVHSGARLVGEAVVQIAERHELPVALTVVPARRTYVDGERAEWHITLSGEPGSNGRLVYRFIDNENRARTVLPP